MAHDVFISYGREDTVLMQQVEKALLDAGLTIWTDKGIAPGSPSWKSAIEQAILDTRCIVVLFSPDSSESRWVRAELDYADAQSKPIYPLLVRGDATNAIPFGFTTYQWIDIRDSARLEAGLAQLIAALKGINAVPAHHSSVPAPTPRKSFRGWLPLLTVVVIVGLVGGLLFMNSRPPTTAPATATIQTAEDDRPTAAVSVGQPTMPPFELAENFQKIEGEKAIFAVPASWTVNMEASIITNLMSGDAQSEAQDEVIQTIINGMDGNAIDLLNAMGTVIAIENIGFSITPDLLRDRQQKMFETFDPEGIFTSAVFVDMPAGTMLYAQGEVSDNTTLMHDYVLLRGKTIYHIMLSGRLTDRAKIETIGEQIARSFRVKE
jgi:hypothetical protein